ncbi:T9SS type B sorting domain-containing protein [Flavobacterium piscisymbiosum]|uniref:T9SS type B sorting domain-containing protein n=1 Tax=Flavobacterium piscisymbiosum TaxID=2893753 RepID=A0ABS8MM96_9FLAO|nr:T9SS type B sorting domain-containing protein [Flavobacterium sp. F-30]MCC9066615.1 T9SS type B sorting domain-containing protein [Flavobacterium sp. F-30]
MKQTLLLFFLLFTSHLFSQSKTQSIGFKENKGQIIDQKGKSNTAVKYLLNSNGLNVQLKKNGFSYDVYEVNKIPVVHSQTAKTLPYQIPEKDKEEKPEYNLEYNFHRIDIDFVNSNSKVELITEQKSADFDNYYNIPNKPEGITGVHQFKQITYKNIYLNIDVVFTIPNDPKKVVEYNFIIHPKGKISDIQLKFSGAETDLVDNKIEMNVRFGKMEETLPASWIEEGNRKKEIAVGYRKIKKDVYGFSSLEAVSGKTIVIDPVPTRLWGTFYGDHTGSGQVLSPSSISTDSFGNAYVAGSTNAQNSSYATTGAHQTTPSSVYLNGIIEKFAPNGNRLWGTYYGGQNYSGITDVKIDFQDNIIVTGTTQDQTNISTAGSYKPNLGGYQDAFLIKFNSSGIRLWGTYFGGEYEDSGFALDVDNNNNIYIIGLTNSTTGIAINSKFQTHINVDPAFSNTIDGFLAKFGSSGNLIWSSYVGGENRDIFNDIVVKNNYLIIGGYTYSFNNISTPGVFQELHNPITHSDGVLYKFSLNGERIWSTYYGGEQIDEINAVEVDDEDNIYIGGETASNNNITTAGSFESNNTFSYKGFFAKLNSNGQRIWGSYLGQNHIYSIVFRNNSIYFGATNSGFSNPKLTNACSYRSNKHFERYIAKFSKEADFIWGTDIGGDAMQSPTKIALDRSNNIFASGISRENNGIADASSYQSNILGFHNYFLMKFEESVILGIPKAESNSPVCIGKTLELKASGGTNYSWTGPNGFTSTDQNPTITNATTLNSGEYSCLITGTGGCDDTKKITVFIGDVEKPVHDIVNLPTITGDCNTIITTIPTATDVCAGAITGTTTNPLSYNLPGTYTIVWSYNDGNGNISTQSQTVNITSQPLPTANSPQTFCFNQNATLDDIVVTGQNKKWYDAATAGVILPNTTTVQNEVTYYVSQTTNGCESARIPVKTKIQNTLPPTGDANQPFCTGQNPTIANLQINGDLIKWYDSVDNGVLLQQTTNLVDGKTYYASQTINGCESPRIGIKVSIVNTPSAPTGNANQEFCKSENATLNDIQITGQNTKWYDTNFSAAVLPNTTLLENNKTYYVSQTIGCESDRTPILVQVYDTPLPIGNNNQQFCIDEIATLENITLTGTAIKWYDSATNGNILSETTLLQNAIYYATQTVNNCESKRLAITVKIQDTQNPIADSAQTFCVQQNASIKSINITGQNIKWYQSTSSNNTLSETTVLENGITYYASQTINNCESDRIPITINILEATQGDCINFVDELPFPKFFTPNNDGYNDIWAIDFAYLKPNTGIKIFDRYGKFIKELSPNTSWDGTYLGTNEPASDYWFTATRLNGKEYRGHFTLKR